MADIGLIVPTMALLATMGAGTDDLTKRADDVRLIVATIGRGALVSTNVEAATRRLTKIGRAHV